MRRIMSAGYKTARKLVIGVVGFTVLGLGVALVVLPGPAVVVVPLGLGILALEFAWARRWLTRLRDGSSRAVAHVRRTAN